MYMYLIPSGLSVCKCAFLKKFNNMLMGTNYKLHVH